MILQVKNLSDHNQPITLHTGESKVIESGSAIKINTGTDKRLINFYAQLVNYEFDIQATEASGQEMNHLADALERLRVVSKVAASNKVLQDKKVFPESQSVSNETPVEPRTPYNPKTLDEAKASQNNPIPLVEKKSYETEVPKVQYSAPPVAGPGIEPNPVVMDSKIGEPIPDYSAQLPTDYPDDPNAVAELNRIEQAEAKAKAEQESSDAKWYELDKLDDETLKRVLAEKFEEPNTKLRNKSKIIYHIMDLAEDAGIDVYELVAEYLN